MDFHPLQGTVMHISGMALKTLIGKLGRTDEPLVEIDSPELKKLNVHVN